MLQHTNSILENNVQGLQHVTNDYEKVIILFYFTTYKQITIKKIQGLQHVTNDYEKVFYFILFHNI